MSEQNLLHLERLLEQAGSVEETDEDTRHRYALRRGLLNSAQFERHRVRQAWIRACSYTVSMVVGGTVAVVVVVGIMTIELDDPSTASGFARGMAETESQAAADFGDPERDGEAGMREEPSDMSVGFGSFARRPEVQYVLDLRSPGHREPAFVQ